MKKTLKTLAVVLTLILLLCACGKTKGTESKPSNDNVSSYGDSSQTGDGDLELDDSDFDSDDGWDDFDTPYDEDDSDVSDESDDSDFDSDEESEEYIIPPFVDEYEDTGIHDPVKVLTPAEMIAKCLSDGLGVKNTVIDIGLNKPVKIARITDSHLGFSFRQSEIINGNCYRHLKIDGVTPFVEAEKVTFSYDSDWQYISDSFRPENAQYVENGLKYAKNADMVVMLGDNVNSSTNDKSVDTLEKIVWDKYPNNICVFGNHELEYATDKAAQREVLEEIWPHNTVYCKKIVKDKLYLIGMDNASESYSFTDEQCEMLEADIKEAREIGATIILLQHISPVALDNSLGANAQMAEILANNGDVIKAVFSGHNHMDSLDYVDSCYETADGKIVETSIPCYRLMSSKYDEEKNNYGANVLVLAVNF